MIVAVQDDEDDADVVVAPGVVGDVFCVGKHFFQFRILVVVVNVMNVPCISYRDIC